MVKSLAKILSATTQQDPCRQFATVRLECRGSGFTPPSVGRFVLVENKLVENKQGSCRYQVCCNSSREVPPKFMELFPKAEPNGSILSPVAPVSEDKFIS